jgi:hypothetical protein
MVAAVGVDDGVDDEVVVAAVGVDDGVDDEGMVAVVGVDDGRVLRRTGRRR